jgi:hypothetical protein
VLRLTKLSNQYRRRTLRPLYESSQAYPYAASLSTNFDRTGGQLSGGQVVTGSKTAILPGAVAIKLVGETVTLAGSPEGAAPNVVTNVLHPFGLFGNFVGGELDELGDRAEVSVWKGPGAVFEVLAPAFDDTGLAAATAAEDGTAAAVEVYLQTGTDGRMVYSASALQPWSAANKAVARVVNRLSSNAVVVELLV